MATKWQREHGYKKVACCGNCHLSGKKPRRMFGRSRQHICTGPKKSESVMPDGHCGEHSYG
ncbi:MAG: hypothetical protein Q7S53_00725 [bacterium]|nr:hypothetical protein [bacterium]